MTPKTLLLPGLITLLVGAFLYWAIPIELPIYETYPNEFRSLSPVLFWFCTTLIGAGGLLVSRALLGQFFPRRPPVHGLSMFPGLILRNVLPWRRHRRAPLIAELPSFGIVYGAILWILIFLFMVEPEHHLYGLPIRFETHAAVLWERSPWQETLSVYLTDKEDYYINGRPVVRGALRRTLEQELGRRMVWVVYFDADRGALNGDAIYAMDVIRSLGARLIWLTPSVRKELEQKSRN
jgi:biopolymer transport protein ExbD